MDIPVSAVSGKYIKSKNAECEREVAATKTQVLVLLVVLYLYGFWRLIVCVVIHPQTAFHWAVCSDVYQVTWVQGTIFGEWNWRHNLWRVPQCDCPIFINTWNCTSAKQGYHLIHFLCIENTEEHLHVVGKKNRMYCCYLSRTNHFSYKIYSNLSCTQWSNWLKQWITYRLSLHLSLSLSLCGPSITFSALLSYTLHLCFSIYVQRPRFLHIQRSSFVSVSF